MTTLIGWLTRLTIPSALLAAFAVLGAARLAQAQLPPPPARRFPSADAHALPVHPDTAIADSAPAEADPDSIAVATREYRETGAARTIIEGNFVTFPYGHAQPVLTCAVLRACVIELEPGEIVLSRIAGDTERWEIVPAPAGRDGRTTLVVVKPRDCDLTTNLFLATDRRLYDLTLDAQPCKASAAKSAKSTSTNPQQPYARHVRFYYPDDTVAEWARPAPVRIGPEVLALNFHYRIKKDKQFPWAPAQVFDDSARVYILLPDVARHREAPALFVLEPDGSKTLLNYTFANGDTHVTDRLFDRAVLVAGVDGKERHVLIEREERAGR